MATVLTGSGMKVNGSISVSGGTTGTILYTAPATGYAIIEVGGSGGATISVGDAAFAASIEYQPTGAGTPMNGIYVGPTQKVKVAANATVTIVGVEFINI